MAYRYGEDLFFLNSKRAITTYRLWAVRIFIVLTLFSRQADLDTTPAINIHMPFESLGYILGTLAIYAVLLWVASVKTDSIEEPEEEDFDGVDGPTDTAQHELIDFMSESGVTTKYEFQRQTFANSDSSIEDKDQWWDEYAKPFLQDHPDVEQLDSTEQRWRLNT